MTALPPLPRPRVLCVDDDANVLEGLKLSLRRKFEVLTALSGPLGLELLATTPQIAVIISDMRMPEMDGATFLAQSRSLAPDAVRVLLTGQADVTSAIASVNEGQIFRFLQKPTPPAQLMATIESAAEHHRLITAERELIEETLQGCVKTLTEVMSLTAPLLFARAQRVKRLTTRLGELVRLEVRWRVEMAALVAPLGFVSVPAEVMEKVFANQPLAPAEEKMVAAAPQLTEQLLVHIPRLEAVRRLLALSQLPIRPELLTSEGPLAREAQVLRAATEFERRTAAVPSPEVAVEHWLTREPTTPEFKAALLLMAKEEIGEVFEVDLDQLRVGMVLLDDIRLGTGVLLVPKGFSVTQSFIERARNFQPGVLKLPLRVGRGSALMPVSSPSRH